MKREFVRKLIHLSTLAAPLLVWVMPREVGLWTLGGAAAIAVGVEWGRARSNRFRAAFLQLTGSLLRPHEVSGVSGATYLAFAYFLCLLLFPEPVAVLAMLYGGAGDAVAALVGKRWGRRRTSWGKSWEGAGAAFALCAVLGMLMPGILPIAALLGAFAAAALEFLPLPIDDNLSVALGGGAILSLATWLPG